MTVDEYLDWYRQRGLTVWLGCHSETPLTVDTVELCIVGDGYPTLRPKDSSLVGALALGCQLVRECRPV